MRNTVIEDVRQLSSGTIARICGSPLYSEIEAFQAKFVAFVADCGGRFETWQDALEAWQAASQQAPQKNLATH